MEFKHIEKWTRPSNYMGPNYYGYYQGPVQHRDSDALGRSNFRMALSLLGGESPEQIELTEGQDDSEHIWPVMVIRDSHWAVGWIEYILVHESAIDKLEILNKIYEDLDGYPVLDESDFTEEEMNEANETLENYASEFRKEVLKFIGFNRLKEYGVSRRKRLDALDEFCSAVYHEDTGYCGLENAWVSKKSIKRFVELKYPPYPEIVDNLFYKLCKAT